MQRLASRASAGDPAETGPPLPLKCAISIGVESWGRLAYRKAPALFAHVARVRVTTLVTMTAPPSTADPKFAQHGRRAGHAQSVRQKLGCLPRGPVPSLCPGDGARRS